MLEEYEEDFKELEELIRNIPSIDDLMKDIIGLEKELKNIKSIDINDFIELDEMIKDL
ncbi:MAG: hypothetical protein ACTHW2_08060 [Tissierella sp.]|uniref:hypothetical protein n=1 Tax=Tissierella sp. TaxID=41274 RepID=UPI003F96BCBA